MPNQVRSPLKHGRLRRGMTLQELAEKCAADGVPVTESTLSRIERGRQTPRPKLRSVLASLLSVDIEEFERAAALTADAAGSTS